MTPHTEKLLAAIADYESKCGLSPESILESLWYDYSCRRPVDMGQVRAAEARLSLVHRQLSMEASDSLSDMVAELLTSYQRAAYLDGMRMGVHLLLELSPTSL